MNFFKKIILILSFIFLNSMALADSHDKEKKNIVEKAKEVNQQVKQKQATKNANISSEVGSEEPLPLNLSLIHI